MAVASRTEDDEIFCTALPIHLRVQSMVCLCVFMSCYFSLTLYQSDWVLMSSRCGVLLPYPPYSACVCVSIEHVCVCLLCVHVCL